MDNKIKVVVVIISIIILAIILGITIGRMNSYKNQSINDLTERIEKEEKKNSVETNIVEENEIEDENVVEENVIEENLVEDNNTSKNEAEENTVKENTTKENSTTENIKKEETNKKTQEDTSSKVIEKDPEKRAISLAKEKWGNTNSDVYFDVEDESKGVYTIVVRDNNTTVEMVTYKVDINKNTVTEQ